MSGCVDDDPLKYVARETPYGLAPITFNLPYRGAGAGRLPQASTDITTWCESGPEAAISRGCAKS